MGMIILFDLMRERASNWKADHTHNAPFSVPVLVLDMYEHAFQMDYGAAAAKYVDAFMQNINWEEVNRRVETIKKLQFS
jgi:Fe-Mn family superoxide dismutase